MASRPPSWQRQLLTTLTRLDEGVYAMREDIRGMREEMRAGFATISHFVDRNERESSTRLSDLEARVARLEESRST